MLLPKNGPTCVLISSMSASLHWPRFRSKVRVGSTPSQPFQRQSVLPPSVSPESGYCVMSSTWLLRPAASRLDAFLSRSSRLPNEKRHHASRTGPTKCRRTDGRRTPRAEDQYTRQIVTALQDGRMPARGATRLLLTTVPWNVSNSRASRGSSPTAMRYSWGVSIGKYSHSKSTKLRLNSSQTGLSSTPRSPVTTASGNETIVQLSGFRTRNSVISSSSLGKQYQHSGWRRGDFVSPSESEEIGKRTQPNGQLRGCLSGVTMFYLKKNDWF